MSTRLIYLDSDIFAGTERHVLDLLAGLRTGGQAAALAVPADTPLAEHARAEGHDVWPVEKRGLIDIAAIGQLVRWLRAGEVDVIHAHNGRTALQATLAKVLARRGAVVMTQHFIAPTRTTRRGPKRWLSHLIHGWMSRRIDHLVAISTAVREAMLARGECHAERVTVVFNGMADPRAADVAPREQVRESLGVSAQAPLVVCAARLQPEKDIWGLVVAMAKVVRAFPQVRCVIAGQGVEQALLERQIARLGLSEHVHLLGFRKDVRSIMAAGDLFVLPAPKEGFGLVLVEAMAFGKAVVATRAGGPLDIVADRETGMLVEPMNPRALAEAMAALLRDPARRQAMGERGRERFEQRFTADRMARATAAVYDKATRREPATPPQPTVIER